MVFRVGIQKSQCVAVSKLVLIDLSLVAKVYQSNIHQVAHNLDVLTLSLMEKILDIVLGRRNAVQDLNDSFEVELSHELFFSCHFSKVVQYENLREGLSDKLNEDLLSLHILFVYQEWQDFGYGLDFLGGFV